jgi:hypothetical protein
MHLLLYARKLDVMQRPHNQSEPARANPGHHETPAKPMGAK